MRLKRLYTSVAAALALGGATTALAQQYYVTQPVATEGVIVQERVVTRPAQPAMVAVPGERITMTYTADDAYPFPSPQTHITQSGVFVPDQPQTVTTAPSRVVAPAPWHRSFNTDPPFNTD